MKIETLNREVASGYDLTFLEGIPYVYHCHHYNLFHEQTIDDALGEERGARLRLECAYQAARPFLERILRAAGAQTPPERLQVARQQFASMGQGLLNIAADGAGGSVVGDFLHYGLTWREKYGAAIRRNDPADAVALGYVTAAVELAFDLPAGHFAGKEVTCIARREAACTFQLEAGAGPRPDAVEISDKTLMPLAGATFDGIQEERIAEIALGLREFLGGVEGDERGLIHAFNVYVTQQLSAYYSNGIYRTVRAVEAEAPGAVAVVESLFREAGHVCVFNTFGNILLSPEWEGMVGAPDGDPQSIITSCCATARGLGFGHWVLAEHEPGVRLVLRTPATYEAPIDLLAHGRSNKGRCYVFQGAALALMVLSQKVEWRSSPQLNQEFYLSLFRSGALPWKVEETHCLAKGDSYCEAVVKLVQEP